MMLQRTFGIGLTLVCACADATANDQAVASCGRRAEVREEIPLNSGVYTEKAQVAIPNRIAVHFYVDSDALADCLRRNGLVSDVAQNAYLARLAACRDGRRTTRAVIARGESPRLVADRSIESLESCLSGAPEVDVEIPGQ